MQNLKPELRNQKNNWTDLLRTFDKIAQEDGQNLPGGVAVINVGAATEVEMKERRKSYRCQ